MTLSTAAHQGTLSAAATRHSLCRLCLSSSMTCATRHMERSNLVKRKRPSTHALDKCRTQSFLLHTHLLMCLYTTLLLKLGTRITLTSDYIRGWVACCSVEGSMVLQRANWRVAWCRRVEGSWERVCATCPASLYSPVPRSAVASL